MPQRRKSSKRSKRLSRTQIHKLGKSISNKLDKKSIKHEIKKQGSKRVINKLQKIKKQFLRTKVVRDKYSRLIKYARSISK